MAAGVIDINLRKNKYAKSFNLLTLQRCTLPIFYCSGVSVLYALCICILNKNLLRKHPTAWLEKTPI